MTTRLYVGPKTGGSWTKTDNWSPSGVPASGDVSLIEQGTPLAIGETFTNQTLWVYDPYNVGIGLNLVNSVITPSTELITYSSTAAVSIGLQNMALQGGIYTASGPTQFLVYENTTSYNTGLMTVSGGSGSASATVIADGDFRNYGTIDAGQNGTFSIYYGKNFPEYAGGGQVITNYGVIEADPGGRFNVQTFSSGDFVNRGSLIDNGGYMVMNSIFLQSSTGKVSITNNGSLYLANESVGGTIMIQSGMLDFNTPSAMTFLPTLDFQGSSATLRFENAFINAAYDLPSHSLDVTAYYSDGSHRTSQIDVVDRGYGSGNFTVLNGVQGAGEIIFHPAG